MSNQAEQTTAGAATAFTPECPVCGATTIGADHASCAGCGGPVGFRYATPLRPPAAPLGLWAYAAWLPIAAPEHRVSLGEGGAPLIPARGDYGCQVWFKDESRNPTGSQKDRALALAVSAARERGVGTVILASAGSTGLAAAAYAARAGLRCVVLAPAETPDARIQPLLLYGATVLRFPGLVDEAFAALARVRATGLAMEVSTIRHANPFQAEAPRTIAFELAAQLGEAPDWCIIPTGGGGTLAGMTRGFQELIDAGLVARAPRMASVQPAHYNALERALAEPARDPRELATAGDRPTVLTKLAHTFPPDGLEALDCLRATDGAAVSVGDAEALAAQAALGRQEGLFVEPSSAAALAGLRRLVERGAIAPAARVVVCLTGNGFRELAALPAVEPGRVATIPATEPAAWLARFLEADG